MRHILGDEDQVSEIRPADIARFREQAQDDALALRSTTIDPQDLCALLDEIRENWAQLAAIAKARANVFTFNPSPPIQALLEATAVARDRNACTHSKIMPTFDYEASKGLDASEVRARWPRVFAKCPDCDFNGILYASFEHFTTGDW